MFPLILSCAANVQSVARGPDPDGGLMGFPRTSYEDEDINGNFPDAVYIKTRTQTFNAYHYYILKDGLIWYKGISPGSGPADWMLFMKTGLPHNDNSERGESFEKPRYIAEIAADADELTAISPEGRFYRICLDWIFSRKTNEWYDVQGWPREEALYLDSRVAQNTGWSLGKRNSQVKYYEDPFGNQHHNGTQEIATVYVLLADGQEIAYADSGLPSDFSRNFIGPERGAFKAAALSASASTMFVINEAGEMYTRIADFDIVGCDPMLFKYTYIPYESNIAGTKYRSNLTAWGLPSEDWYYQPRIPLQGDAAITRHITILQNGQGNAARELRVAGLNDAGHTGYWSKNIFDAEWSFVMVPLLLTEDAFLKTEEYPGGRGERGLSPDTRMTGFFWDNGKRLEQWNFEIPNFNILEGFCDLIIRRGGESCSVVLHPVELWTYLRRDHLPGRNGPPKIFFVTLDVPEGALDGLSEEFKDELNRQIKGKDKKLFAYAMEASGEYLLIRSQDSDGGEKLLFLTDGSISDYYPDFSRSWAFNDYEEFLRYHSPELKVKKQPVLTRDNYAELVRKAELNRQLKKELEARISEFESLKKSTRSSRIAYSAVDFFTHITLLYRIDVPKIYTVTRFGGEIMSANESYMNMVSSTRIWMDRKLLEMLNIRIKSYEKAAKQFADGERQASFPVGYAESSLEYWEKAGLPFEMEGQLRIENHTEKVRLNPSPLEQDFLGWTLEAGEEPAFSLLVEPEHAAEFIFERNGRGPEDKPYRFNAMLHVISVGSSEESRNMFRDTIEPLLEDGKGIKVSIHFDGSELVIKKKRPLRKALVFFEGRREAAPPRDE